MKLGNLVSFINHIVCLAKQNEYDITIQANDQREELVLHISASRDARIPTCHRILHVSYVEVLDCKYPEIMADEYMKRTTNSLEEMIDGFYRLYELRMQEGDQKCTTEK